MSAPSADVSGFVESHGVIRTFLVESVLEAQSTQEFFTYPTNYSPELLFGKSYGIFISDPTVTIKVVIEFPAHLYEYIANRTWIADQRVTRPRLGRFRLTVRVSDLFEIMHWVMQFGSEVKLISPQKLKKLISEEAVKILEQT